METKKIDLKEIIVIAIGLVGLIAIIFGLPPLIELLNPQVCTVDGVCEHETRLNMLIQSIPFFVGAGIVVGAGIYYFMSKRLAQTQSSLHGASEIVLQFLGKEEKAVVKRLVDEEGKCLQSEISRIEGIGKLRSHRILQRLKDKGVIEIEPHGKTNLVRLSKSVKEGML